MCEPHPLLAAAWGPAAPSCSPCPPVRPPGYFAEAPMSGKAGSHLLQTPCLQEMSRSARSHPETNTLEPESCWPTNSYQLTWASVSTHAMVNALADFEKNLNLLVWGVSLMHTTPPLLDPLQYDAVGNSDSRWPPQLLDLVLLQQKKVALEPLEAAVMGSGRVNAAVEVRRNGLQSHFVDGELHQRV